MYLLRETHRAPLSTERTSWNWVNTTKRRNWKQLNCYIEMGQPPTVVRDYVDLRQADGARARAVLAAATAVCIVVPFLPFGGIVGYPILLLSTLAHEMGHGLTAMLVGLEFDSFRLYADGSGVAMIGGHAGRLSRAATAAGGLTGPAVAGALLFWLSSRARLAPIALMVFGALMLAACVLVIRNVFGLAFVGAMGGSLFYIGMRFGTGIAQFTAALLAVQMALSVFAPRGLSLHPDRDDQCRSDAFRRCAARRPIILAVLVLGCCLRSNLSGRSGLRPIRVLETF